MALDWTIPLASAEPSALLFSTPVAAALLIFASAQRNSCISADRANAPLMATAVFLHQSHFAMRIFVAMYIHQMRLVDIVAAGAIDVMTNQRCIRIVAKSGGAFHVAVVKRRLKKSVWIQAWRFTYQMSEASLAG